MEELPFPGQSKWREVWPDWDGTNKTAPIGWMTGEGYPQRRAVIGGQWHFSPSGDLINDPHHIHVECALPGHWRDDEFIPECISGVIQLDVRIVGFHLQSLQATFKYLQASLKDLPSSAIMMPAPWNERFPGQLNAPILETDHLREFYIPVRINTAACLTDGLKGLRLGINFIRVGDFTHLVSLFWPLRLANGGERLTKHNYDGAIVTGWGTQWRSDPVRCANFPSQRCEVNIWGYINTQLIHWNPSNPNDPTWVVKMFPDDVTSNWILRGSGFFPVKLSAYLNPDLHKHPPDFGTVLLPETSITSSKQIQKVLSQVTDFDRVVFRVADDKLNNPDGSAATLLTIKMGQTKLI